MMEWPELIEYVRAERFGVVSTIGPLGGPQSAYLAMTGTDAGELVFDAKPDSRKIANLRRDPRVSMVIGGSAGTTLQCEGIADLPDGGELERCAAAYLSAFPEFTDSISSGGVVVVRVALTWARFGDFRADAPVMSTIALP
jgi:general stress protein 26